MKNTTYLLRQTSPVITVAKLTEPCCIITFDSAGKLKALSYTGYIDENQEYIIVAEAWRFAQKNTQTSIAVKEGRRVRKQRLAKAETI